MFYIFISLLSLFPHRNVNSLRAAVFVLFTDISPVLDNL